MTLSTTSSARRIYIVERYHYHTQSSQLPSKTFHSSYPDPASANTVAQGVFQGLMQDQAPNLGYLESKGVGPNGLFRGAIILKQKRTSGAAVERVGVQVRLDTTQLPTGLAGANAVVWSAGVNSRKRGRSASMQDERECKFVRRETVLPVRGSPSSRRRQFADGFGDGMAMDEDTAMDCSMDWTMDRRQFVSGVH